MREKTPSSYASVIALAVIVLCSERAWSAGEPLAFPGAKGFGANAQGGRGGDVYHVTTLEDLCPPPDGPLCPGSLREGIDTASGARTIVFEVGGTIDLDFTLPIKANKLTIAGQTAPGGITLRGYPVIVNGASDIVIRYVRFRPGDINAKGVPGKPGRGNADLPGDAADALGISNSTQVIVDHVSASWSMDETLPVRSSNNVTIQHSIISESLNDSFHPEFDPVFGRLHGHASVLRGRGGPGYSFWGNLLAHHFFRNPAFGGDPDSGLDVDFVNNTIYDWGLLSSHTVDDLGTVRINYESNLLIAGPSTSICPFCVFVYVDPDPGEEELLIYQAGNLIDSDLDGMFDPTPVDPTTSFLSLISFFPFPFVVEPLDLEDQAFEFDRVEIKPLPARWAFLRILLRAGASLFRDAVDDRIIKQVIKQSGNIIDSQDDVGGWPKDPPPMSAPADLDRDGMADTWETKRGLDPDDPEDRNGFDLSHRYTNLEIYLNQVALFGPPSR
jgi:hypothetical protein